MGSRNLVVCCDGTWNTPDQNKDGLPTPTNVVKLFAACNDDADQRKYYHPGVGTQGSKMRRMIDGGIGRGLDRNIKSAYKWLCSNYQAGDRIFLFGFSRGAYTVRSLSGFILECGLLDFTTLSEEETWGRVDLAYQQGYRKNKDKHVWGKTWPTAVDENGETPDVHFVGVWDTVGARGVPDDMVLLDLVIDNPANYRFHNTDLSERVRHAYHAVALDEMRSSFAPTLWRASTRPAGSTFEQVWFAGNHGDVGGGHPECGLSDIALQWVAERAKAQGLKLDDQLLEQLKPDSRGVLHSQITGIWRRLRTLPRAAPLICARNTTGPLHPSVWERHKVPPISQAPYRRTLDLEPGHSASFDVFAGERWNDTGLWLEAGKAYHFSAQGEWIDQRHRCGPDGIDTDRFQLGKLA